LALVRSLQNCTYNDMAEKSAVTNTTAQSGERLIGPSTTVDSLGPSGDESGPSRPPRKERMTDATTDFVFVNETNRSPRFKALNRQRVRSKARSHSARLLKQKPETGLRSLAPQRRGHGASRFLPRGNSRPLTILERRTVAGSDSKPLAYSNDLLSGDDATSSEESPVIDVNLSVIESSPEAEDTNTSVSQPSTSQGHLDFYHKLWGRKSTSIGITTRRPRNSSHPSPRGLLGAGRVDPFLSYPVERPDPDIHELVDLCKSSIVPRRSLH
jgi:hypothetical protein